jgi:hypothetical protein
LFRTDDNYLTLPDPEINAHIPDLKIHDKSRRGMFTGEAFLYLHQTDPSFQHLNVSLPGFLSDKSYELFGQLTEKI